MRAFLCLLPLLLAACGPPQPAAEAAAATPDSNIMVAPEQPCDPYDPCALQDPARMARADAAEERERQRLIRLFASGPGDPVGDARRAAAEGDFRLFWVEGGWESLHVLGLSCRLPIQPEVGRPALMRLQAQSADYSPHGCEPLGANGHPSCPLHGAPRVYMERFNQTLVADPRFPHPDLCGPEDTTGRSRETLAAPIHTLTETPRSLSEAARRGSPASVARLLRGQTAATLNQPDDLGLTPLAWATIERRRDIVRLLLAAGADPLDGHGQWRGAAGLPLAIALAADDPALAARMLTPAVIRRLRPWPCQAVRAVIWGDHVALVRRMLSEPNRCERVWELEHGRSPAMAALLDRLDPRPAIERLNRAIRARSPALVRQALRTGSNPNAAADPRHSPLGDALHAPDPAMLPMVRLLLAAGADPNGPAETAGVPSEHPPTPILVQLITEATSRSPFETTSPRLTNLRRALDLLLAAGASLNVRDWQGRPLAVMTVIGTGVNTPLPPGWLTRLKRAGVDVNATWQGSTALDWLEARGGGDSDTARELIRLGGRRLRPTIVSETDRLPMLPPAAAAPRLHSRSRPSG